MERNEKKGTFLCKTVSLKSLPVLGVLPPVCRVKKFNHGPISGVQVPVVQIAQRYVLWLNAVSI